MKKFLLGLTLAFSVLIGFTSCDEDDQVTPVDTPKNIVDLAKTRTDLSILVDAVVHAELVETLSGSTKFTVFAPTNTAFNTLLQSLGASKITDVDKTVLKNILLYHAVAGEVRAANVTTGYAASAATYGTTTSPLSLYLVKSGSNVSINDGVKVTTADLGASNGVVHIVDKVIALPSIVNHVLNNPNLSVLRDALTRSDLNVDYVSILGAAPGAVGSSAPFTVFAPTNDAFVSVLGELQFANLAAIPAATLNAVLQYHVVAGANVLSTALTDNQQITTFQTGKLTVDLDGGAKLIDAKNRIAKITTVNVQGTNGVIHIIDKVVLPQ
jgi:uncharacterized surface protein with fasciclin (FAS1) repeats